MANAIDDAINKAKEAAGRAPSEANLPSTGVNTSVGTPAQRGTPLGLDDMLSGAISVDAWLKVGEFGLTIGTDRTLFDSIPVVIDMSEIAYCYSVRYGNPAQYAKTYDRVTDVKGGSWIATLQRAQAIDEKASEFRSADIPFHVQIDLKSKDGKTTILEKGKTLGHSLSITGWKSFAEFTKKLAELGIDAYRGEVAVDLGFTVQSNNKGTWGILAFNNPRAVEVDPD
jgi:hypothetical protein